MGRLTLCGAGGFQDTTPPCTEYTVLMLHFDGADADTTFTDSSPSAHTFTVSGNAQLDTAQIKYGSASGLFDGTGDYIESVDSADWYFGSADFTIEGWVRFNAVQFQGIIGQWNGSYGWLIDINSSIWRFSYRDTGNVTESFTDSTLSTGVWYHFAAVRNGSNLMFFRDGTQVGTTRTISTTLNNATSALAIGDNRDFSNPLNGWLDDIRISKGIARYTGTFTVPSGALPNSDC